MNTEDLTIPQMEQLVDDLEQKIKDQAVQYVAQQLAPVMKYYTIYKVALRVERDSEWPTAWMTAPDPVREIG